VFENIFLKKRIPFFVFLFVYILFCLVTFRQYGLVGDEMSCYNGGAVMLKYYKGHNLEAVTTDLDLVTHNYPFAAVLLKLSFSEGVNLERLHLLNLLFASIIFWLMYELLYFSFQDERWALIGPIALFLTPRFLGDIAQNPKDIPFAIFYFLSLSAVFLKDKIFSGRFWKIIGLGILFGFTISNRIVALNLFPLYFLFRLYEGVTEKEWGDGLFGKWFLKEFLDVIAIIIVSQIALIALWPYIGADYFRHFFKTIADSKKYNWDDWILFGGKLIRPSFFPWNYLLGWMTIITPLFLLFYFIYAIFRWNVLWRKKAYFLMILAFGFNLILYFVLKPNIFNGIRHYLFLIPILVLTACFGIIDFYTYFKGRLIRWIFALIILSNVSLVVIQLTRLFPYDYLYFNELVGGIQGANGKYEMDYWDKSVKEAALWLKENEIKDPQKDYKIKLTGETSLAAHYFSENMYGYTDIKDQDANFCFIVNSARGYILPSSGKIIHVVEREGVPLTFVLQMRNQ